jgi:hypothetical protein
MKKTIKPLLIFLVIATFATGCHDDEKDNNPNPVSRILIDYGYISAEVEGRFDFPINEFQLGLN